MMTTEVENIDDLLKAMNLASALHAKYQGTQIKATQAQDKANEIRSNLGEKRTAAIAKAESTYRGRVTVIDKKYEEDMAAADGDTQKAITAQNDAFAALETQQQVLLDDHGAVVDLSTAQSRGTPIVNV